MPFQESVKYQAWIWQTGRRVTELSLDAPSIRGTCTAIIYVLQIVPSAIGCTEGMSGTEICGGRMRDCIVEFGDGLLGHVLCYFRIWREGCEQVEASCEL